MGRTFSKQSAGTTVLRACRNRLAVTRRRLYCESVWKLLAPARQSLLMSSVAMLVTELAVVRVVTAAPVAQAADASAFSLEIEREDTAVSCPDSDWFDTRIASHAGRAGHAGTFRLTLTRRGEVWHARIQRWERNKSSIATERNLQDRSSACAPLAEAAALTIAILADDVAQHAEPTPAEPSAEPASVAAPMITPKGEGYSEPERSSRVWVGAGGGLTAAWISPLAPALGFSGAVDSGSLRFGLRLMMTTEQKFELSPGSVFVQAWLGTAFSCLRLTQGRFGSGLCAAVDLGMLRASAEGFAQGEPSSRSYQAVGLEAQPSWNVSDGYRISMALGALLPFTRESFSVIGRGVAYVPPQLNWRILVFSEIGAF